MQIIPLVRAKYVYAYAGVLDRLGIPKRRLLESVGLSEKVFQNPESIIPAHQVWGFIGSAAQKEGIDDLGLVAGDMSIQDYGAFSERLLQAPNLNQALKIFCQIALQEYSRADFYISRSEQATWFCRGPIDGNEDEKKTRRASGPDHDDRHRTVGGLARNGIHQLFFFNPKLHAESNNIIFSHNRLFVSVIELLPLKFHSTYSPYNYPIRSFPLKTNATAIWNIRFILPLTRSWETCSLTTLQKLN